MLNKLKKLDGIFRANKNGKVNKDKDLKIENKTVKTEDIKVKEKSVNKSVKKSVDKSVNKSVKKEVTLPQENAGIIKQMKAQGVNVDMKLAKAIVSNLSNIKATGVVSLNNSTVLEPCEGLPKEFIENVNKGEYASDVVNLHLREECNNSVERYLISSLPNRELIKTYNYISKGGDSLGVKEHIANVLERSGAKSEGQLKACIRNVINIINKNYEE